MFFWRKSRCLFYEALSIPRYWCIIMNMKYFVVVMEILKTNPFCNVFLAGINEEPGQLSPCNDRLDDRGSIHGWVGFLFFPQRTD